jgi:hypothetical protein
MLHVIYTCDIEITKVIVDIEQPTYLKYYSGNISIHVVQEEKTCT